MGFSIRAQRSWNRRQLSSRCEAPLTVAGLESGQGGKLSQVPSSRPDASGVPPAGGLGFGLIVHVRQRSRACDLHSTRRVQATGEPAWTPVADLESGRMHDMCRATPDCSSKVQQQPTCSMWS